MPSTASTRNSDRDRLRSRLVAPRAAGQGTTAGVSASTAAPQPGDAQRSEAALNSEARLGRAALLEQSPVLFRLPAIESAGSEAPWDASRAPCSERSRSEGPGSLHRDPISLPRGDDVAADIACVESRTHVEPTGPQSSNTQSSNPPPSQHSPTNSLVSGELSAGVVANPHQLASPADTHKVGSAEVAASTIAACTSTSVAALAAATASEDHSTPRRTWWEHWSSGVVLILLVVALVVASIIALNDGGKLESDQLAGQPEASMLDEFDLSSLSIPEISMPSLNVVVDQPLSAAAQNSPEPSNLAVSVAAAGTPTAAAQPATLPAEPSASELATVESPAVDMAASHQAATEMATSETVPGGQVATHMPAAENPSVDVAAGGRETAPELAGQGASSTTGQSTAESIPPLPLATLERPTEMVPAQLFAAQEHSGEPVSPQGSPPIPGMPASTPAVSLELLQTGAMHAEGSSPTLYDGASKVAEQHTASGSTVSSVTQGPLSPAHNSLHVPGGYELVSQAAVGPVDTNMPNISTVLASATASVETGSAPASQVMPSATPDLDGESIVEAYLRFKQSQQATAGAASNRNP